MRDPEKRRATQARYAQTEKGKAATTAYEQSKERKAAKAALQQTEKGKATKARYEQSEKGKATRLAHDEAQIRVRVGPDRYTYKIPPGKRAELRARLDEHRSTQKDNYREARDGGFQQAVA